MIHSGGGPQSAFEGTAKVLPDAGDGDTAVQTFKLHVDVLE